MMTELINRMWYIHHWDIIVLKRKDILTHATTWMNLQDTMLRENNQLQKDEYYMIPLICDI